MKRSTEPGNLLTSSKRLFTACALVLSACAAAADARVKVVVPEMRTFVEALSVQGTVRSKSCAAVSARVAGTIDELCVEEGATVVAGTPLFRIDRANLENAVRSSENDVRIAEAAAILIVDERRAYMERGASARAATLKASVAKFRSVVMSCSAALFGMLPMALGSGLGSELRAAIGIGSVGGILVSSVVSLYFIPALCALRNPKDDENLV